jgi:hypothetical protein
MKHLASAVVLACILSSTAWAGEIPSGDRASSQASGSAVTPGEIPISYGTAPERSASGEIHGAGVTAPDSSTTLLTIALTILGIVR